MDFFCWCFRARSGISYSALHADIQHRVEHLSSTEDAATEAYRGNELLKLAEDDKAWSLVVKEICNQGVCESETKQMFFFFLLQQLPNPSMSILQETIHELQQLLVENVSYRRKRNVLLALMAFALKFTENVHKRIVTEEFAQCLMETMNSGDASLQLFSILTLECFLKFGCNKEVLFHSIPTEQRLITLSEISTDAEILFCTDWLLARCYDNHIDAQLGSASEDEDPEDESLWSSDGERNARQVNRRNVIHLEEEEGDVESDEDEDEESGEEEQFEKSGSTVITNNKNMSDGKAEECFDVEKETRSRLQPQQQQNDNYNDRNQVEKRRKEKEQRLQRRRELAQLRTARRSKAEEHRRRAEQTMHVCLTSMERCTHLKFSADRLTVRNDSASFQSFRSSCSVQRGKYYYEVTLHTAGIIQIGWTQLTDGGFDVDGGNGVGDDRHSYSFDGCRVYAWHRGRCMAYASFNHKEYGRQWRSGDVLGCHLNASSRRIRFSLNGVDMGRAFRKIHIGEGLYAAGSLSCFQQVDINFGHRPFKYTPRTGYRGFNTASDDTLTEAMSRCDALSPTGQSSSLATPHSPLLSDLSAISEDLSIAIPEDLLCRICFAEEGKCTFRYCGHGGWCEACAMRCEVCPLCRAPISFYE